MSRFQNLSFVVSVKFCAVGGPTSCDFLGSFHTSLEFDTQVPGPSVSSKIEWSQHFDFIC
jgi:hypothetical protein